MKAMQRVLKPKSMAYNHNDRFNQLNRPANPQAALDASIPSVVISPWRSRSDSFSSNVSVMTDDMLFEDELNESSKSLFSGQWVDSDSSGSPLGVEQPRDNVKVVSIIDRTIDGVRQPNLSAGGIFQSGSAFRRLRNAMLVPRRLDSDVDYSRQTRTRESILVGEIGMSDSILSETDVNDEVARGPLLNAASWETTIDRVRAGCALAMFCFFERGLHSSDSEMILLGFKLLGVMFLCYLASVPLDTPDRKPTPSTIGDVFISRKSMLLFLYIMAWSTAFDAAIGMRATEPRIRTSFTETPSVPVAVQSSQSIESPDVTVINAIQSAPRLQDHQPTTRIELTETTKEHNNVQRIMSTSNLRMGSRVGTAKTLRGTIVVKGAIRRSKPTRPTALLHSVDEGQLDSQQQSTQLRTVPTSTNHNVLVSRKKGLFGKLISLVKHALRHCKALFIGVDGQYKNQDMMNTLAEVWTNRLWQ